MSKASIAIAGAGIGGLTLAIELGRRGFPVSIFERAPEFERLGAGIVLAPNATFVLRELGLLGELCQQGELLSSMTVRTPKGRALSRAPGTLQFGAFEYPLLALHRANLQSVLVKAALKYPDTRLFMGAPVVDFQESETGVALIGPDGWQEFDLLVGADGVHSSVRRELHGTSVPRYAGQICYRGIAEGDFSLHQEACETWGAGKRFGLVPIGKNRVYWFAVLDAAPGSHVPQERVLPMLKRQFRDFHAPVLNVLDASSETVERDLADAQPLTHWSSDRVTLLGDAAHPMTPNLGQGAGQSIEDAAWLARILDETSDSRECPNISELLRIYEATRIPRTTAFVEESRMAGRIAQLKNPFLRLLRDLVISAIPQRVAERAQHKKLLGGLATLGLASLALPRRPLPTPALPTITPAPQLLRAEITHGQTL